MEREKLHDTSVAERALDYGCEKWGLNPLYVSILESNVLCLILM